HLQALPTGGAERQRLIWPTIGAGLSPLMQTSFVASSALATCTMPLILAEVCPFPRLGFSISSSERATQVATSTSFPTRRDHGHKAETSNLSAEGVRADQTGSANVCCGSHSETSE